MKRLYILMVFIYVALLTVNCSRSSNNTEEFYTFKNYEDIPGISEYEKAAIESIKGSKEFLSYGHLTETEAYLLPDGTATGFTVELCALFTELFGIPFVPKLYEPWESLKDGFDSMEIDFIGELTPTEERIPLYYMTYPIADRSLRLITLSDSEKIKTESDVEGCTLGFYKDVITADSILSSYPFTFNIVYVDDDSEAIELLRSGIIDAIVTEAVMDPYYSKYNDISSKKFFSLIYTPVSISTANPELKTIISVINKYLLAGGIDTLCNLYKKCENEYIYYKLNESLTKEESEYISRIMEHGGIVGIAAEADNYPISFYNEQEKAFQGIAIDILKEVGMLTGLVFEPKTTSDTSWTNILSKLSSGEVSLVTELLYSDERVKEFIWVNKPCITTSYALLSKTDYPDLSPQQIIRTKVGAMRDSIYEEMYKFWFPDNNNLLLYNTQNDAFDALEKGEINLLMASELMLVTQSNYRENPGYKVNISFNTPVDSLFGLNKNETILLSIINKAMAHIDIETISRDWTNRTFDYSIKMANMRTGYLLLFSILLLVVLIVVAILLMRTKRLDKDLVRQTEEAKVASKAKSTFLAHMSHEIRTPLNAIIGMSTIAKSSVENREKTVESIDHIISASNHLLSILNDVLDMSKIESGKIKLSYEPFVPKEAFAEVSEVIRQRCIDKNIHYSSELEGFQDDVVLIGDKLRINQVLFNLLGNSIKFTSAEGNIVFHVAAIDKNSHSITARFTISDTGIGISDEHMKRLFVPFEQGDPSVTARFGGTGLGLSISQNLIRMMSGEVQAESKPGEGSRFWFTLCFEKCEVDALPSDENISDLPDLSGRRILIVDDVEINRLIVKEMLSSIGAEISEAEDGQQALNLFENSPEGTFDLILMDVQMPVMNGYEATKEIRSLKRADSKNIPIIAMTANAYKEDVDEAIAAGMNAHLPKPLDMQKLYRTLAIHCLPEQYEKIK